MRIKQVIEVKPARGGHLLTGSNHKRRRTLRSWLQLIYARIANLRFLLNRSKRGASKTSSETSASLSRSKASLVEAEAALSIGRKAYLTGAIEEARFAYDKALPLFKAEQSRLGEANTLKSLGDLEDSLGEPLKAIRYYDDARILCSLIRLTKNAEWLAKRISELKNSEGA